MQLSCAGAAVLGVGVSWPLWATAESVWVPAGSPVLGCRRFVARLLEFQLTSYSKHFCLCLFIGHLL